MAEDNRNDHPATKEDAPAFHEPNIAESTSSETVAPSSPEMPKDPAISIRRSTYPCDVKNNDTLTHGVFHAIDSTSKQPTIHMWLQYTQLGHMAANHFRAKNYDTFLFTPYSSRENWTKMYPDFKIVAEIRPKKQAPPATKKSNNDQGIIDDFCDVIFTGSYLSIAIKMLLCAAIVSFTAAVGVHIGREYESRKYELPKEKTYTGKGWLGQYEQKCVATDNKELGLREKTALLFGESKKSDEEHAEALISWLEKEGGYFHPNLQMRRVDPSDPTSFFGMFSNDSIPKGEVILRIPRNMVLDSTEEDPDIDSMICSTVRNLIDQLKLKDDSKYAPYVNYLLDTQPPGCPSAWSKAGKDLFTRITTPSDSFSWVDKLSPPQWSEAGKNFLSSVTGQPKKVVNLPPHGPFPWINEWHESCDGSDDPLEEYAALIVIQRSWDDKLIPVFDTMSHGNGRWLNTAHSDVHDTTIDVEVTASRDIKANEQIHTSYNMCESCGNRKYEYGTGDILREYGFVEQMPQSFYFSDMEFGYRLDENVKESGKGKGYGKALVTEWVYKEPTAEDVKKMKQMLEQIQIAKVTQLSKQCDVDDFEWETSNNYVKALENGLKAAVRAAQKQKNEGDKEIEVIGLEELENESSDYEDDYEDDSGDEL
mmetsp:Transcript_26540/g.40899  ORF Transcript_26540/g.40899 Transcript_26540/m.40899 type:complete len:650 (+) Transcript_26540:62-2011(+)